MIITEVLPLKDGRCLVRAVNHDVDFTEGGRFPVPEWVVRLPTIEYIPKVGDDFDFISLREDRRCRLQGGPWIRFSVNDYVVLSGTCVGMPIHEAMQEYL